MKDYEEQARGDAAYDAWRSGRNYDRAWDDAEEAIYQAEPYDYGEAYDAATQRIRRDGA